MENINCIICSSESTSPFLMINDRLANIKEDFQLVKCECGLVYLNPRPKFENIKKFYQSHEYDPHKNLKNNFRDKTYKIVQKLTLKWKHKIITSFITTGALLDIGGGRGAFAKFMKEKGWEVTLQENFGKIDKRINGLHHIKKLEELDCSDKFDVITLWHSLEHIHDIHALFNKINKFLNPVGILLIAVPNINAPERKFYNKNWAPYDAPRHLYHFNLSSLTLLCSNYGYEIVQKFSLYQDTPYNILLSIKNYNLIQLIKAGIVFFYSFITTLIRGPNYASSTLILCRKSI